MNEAGTLPAPPHVHRCRESAAARPAVATERLTALPDGRLLYRLKRPWRDIPILKRVGFPVAVANARLEVIARAAFVTHATGGRGAIREVVELILKAQGKWDSTLSEFLS